jgi:Xaa-Pro dipeptidase
VLEARGYGTGFTHTTGHQVGFRYHDKGLRLEPGSIALLEEGLVVTVEPGAYGSAFGGGARFEDNVYVDEVGSEVLSA